MKQNSPNKPKKSLGQNFLTDSSVAPKMVELSGIDKSYGVIEIGPGHGALTGALTEAAGSVTAIELDSDLIPELNGKFGSRDGFKLINADVLELDLAEIIKNDIPQDRVAVFGNLPYYITSPIIMKLLESRLPICSVTAMVQKEAAQRLCAEPKSREGGAVTMAVRYYSEPHILFDVPPTSFYPAPKVTSSVIRLDVLGEPSAKPQDERFMFAVIKAAFSQRRKTVANSIAAGLNIDKVLVCRALAETGLDEKLRAENISVSEYSDLSDALAPLVK